LIKQYKNGTQFNFTQKNSTEIINEFNKVNATEKEFNFILSFLFLENILRSFFSFIKEIF